MLADTGVDQVEDGLVLLEGPNGAGKSTLLEFLTSVLFGYSTGRGSNKYAETPGGLRGGVVTLQTNDGRLIRWERGTPPPASGSLSVLSEGVAVDPFGWLGSASRDLYGSVFALGIDELRDGVLNADRQAAVEAAITGMGVRGLPTALSTTEKEVKAIDKRIKEIQGELEASTKDLDLAKARSREYDEVLDASRQAEMRVAQLRVAHVEAKESSTHLGQLSRAWGAWCQLEEARARLAGLGGTSTFDEGGLERLRHHRDQELRLSRTITRLQTELDQSQLHLKSLPVNENLISSTAEIESLAAGLQLLREAELGLEDRERQVESASRILREAFLQLGPNWDQVRLFSVDTSIASHAEGAKLSGLMTAHRQESVRLADLLKDRKREWQAAEEGLSTLKDRLSPNPDASGIHEVDRKTEVLEQLRGLLVKRDAAQSELNWREHAASAATSTPTSGLPKWVLTFAIIVVVFTVIAALTKLWALIGVGLVLGMFLRVADRPAQAEPAADLEHLREEVRRLESERKRLTESEGWTVERSEDLIPIQAELRKASQGAIRRESESQRLEDASSAVDRLRKLKEQTEDDLITVQTELEAAVQQWRLWCAEKGYPEDLEADSLLVFEGQISATRLALEKLEQATRERDQFVTRISRASSQLATLKARLEEPEPVGAVSDGIADLQRRLDAAHSIRRDAAETSQRITTLERDLKASNQELGEVQQTIAETLAAAGVDEDEKFLAAYHAAREAVQVRQEYDKAQALLVQISGPGDAFHRLSAALSAVTDGVDLQSRADDADRAFRELTERLREAEDATLRLGRDLQNLESGADLGAALARRAEFQAELESMRKRWLETTLARLLLLEAKDRYQNQVQDGVFERASYYMKQLTDGQSETIRKDGDSYFVLDRDGTRRSVSQLNRSHAERLLLSVRLGYIDNYCEKREPLPIVLDDVLVNFDPHHQALAVQMIADLSKRHQVIYLTCHPSTRALFEAHAGRFQHVRLSKWRFDSSMA